MSDRGETDVAPHRWSRVVVPLAYVLALLAWLALSALVRSTPAMDGMRMTDPGVPEAMALANGLAGVALYLVTWGVMMVAMMYPGSARTFGQYASATTDATASERARGLVAFVGTYTLVWALTGVVPLAVNLVVPLARVAAERGLLLLGGSLLALAAYQLSPFKHRCLRHCRAPRASIDRAAARRQGAVPLAWHLTLYDIGSCWALMALVVVVGSMNILWMAVVTLTLSLERLAARGEAVARGVGLVAGVAGTGLLLWELL